jgi:hypothetical protein
MHSFEIDLSVTPVTLCYASVAVSAYYIHVRFWKYRLSPRGHGIHVELWRLVHLIGTFVLTISYCLLASWVYIISDLKLTIGQQAWIQIAIAVAAIGVIYGLLWAIPNRFLKR